MNEINPLHLKKSELQIYTIGRCIHGHLYQNHPNCFKLEILQNQKKIRIGVIDTEFFSFNFNADQGIILTYAIKEYHKNKWYCGKIDHNDNLKKILDYNIIKKLVKDMSQFDYLIHYYGTRCDIPFIRTRALRYGIPFIKYGFIKQIDVYYLVKHKLKLKRNSLTNACNLLGINGHNNNELVESETWIKAVLGDKKSLNYIDRHCHDDVRKTEKVLDKLECYGRKTNRSI